MHNELINVPSLLLKNTFLLTTKLPNNLLRLKIHTLYKYCRISLSFIAKFSNLQELELSFRYVENFVDFKKLQYIIFPQLQILTLKYSCPRYEFLIKFLENNGKNLKVLYLGCYSDDNSLNLAIAKFCPKLKKLSTRIKSNELETLKIILDNCQYLESIKIWCGGKLLSEKEALEIIVKYSKNIYEIILCHQFDVLFELLPNELEFYFKSWMNNNSRKSLLLFVATNNFRKSLDKYDENLKIIEKYIKLGVIKKFEVTKIELSYY
jgi:hypothetical protein